MKSYNEFYFLANPELLIKTHFPVNAQWQLTKKKYTLDEFLSWPQVKSNFFTYGFEKYYPEEGLIKLKNSNTQKFIIYGNDMNKKGATCSLYFLEGNCYKQQLNTSKINFYEDKFEIATVFNKKGKYKIEIFGNTDRGKHFNEILEYAAIMETEPKKKLVFPTFYSGKEEIMERVYALIDKYNSDLKKSFNNKNQGISLSLDNVDADYLYKKLLCDLEEIYIEVNLLRGKYKEPVKMLEYTRDCIEALGSNEDVEITDDLIGDILLLKKNILPFLDDDDMILELKNIFYRWEKRLVSYIMGEKDTFLEKITDVDSFKLSIRKELMGYLSDLNTKIRNKNIVKEVKDGYVNLALGVFHKEKDDFINNFLDEIKMLILEIREKGNDNEIGEMEKILNKEIKLDDNVNNSLTVITNLYVSLYKILLEINEREERLMKLDDYTISISRGK